jgi:amidase
MPVTESIAYGPARNPWNTDYTPGGSSGGSAAMVAAGCVPFAHANDGGGSIRIPAASCGLVGLKPTRGRNPKGPIMGDVMNGLVEEHVVSRTVRDTAAMLDATAGPEPGDPYSAPPQAESYLKECQTDPGSLRIGLFTTNLRTGEKVHPDNAFAAEDTARQLEELGHHVGEVRLDFLDYEMFSRAFTAIWAASATALLDTLSMMTGKELRQQDFEPMTWGLYETGKQITGGEYQQSMTLLQMVGRGFGGYFQNYDILLTPTLGQPIAKVGQFHTNEADIEKAFAPLLDYLPFTPLFNGTGNPSISLPLHWSNAGLPVGVMFTADMGREDTLLKLAGQMEEARPWKDKRPPVWG